MPGGPEMSRSSLSHEAVSAVGPERLFAAPGRWPYARLPRAPSGKGLQHVRPLPPAPLREGDSSMTDVATPGLARHLWRTVGHLPDLSFELEPPRGGGRGELCERAIGPGRRTAAPGREQPSKFVPMLHASQKAHGAMDR